jgi:hypothetical protein
MLVVRVSLVDHLTVAQLDAALGTASKQLATVGEPAALVVDCLRMRSYDIEARNKFTAWVATDRGSVGRVAVVTDKIIWQMVVRTMSLIARQEMKSFSSVADAELWIQVQARGAV